MDALSDILAPYSAEIGKFSGFVTCLQFLSGGVFLNNIRKRGSSDPYPVEPFLGGIMLTVLSLKLGAIMGDMPMIKVNIIGFAINVVFLLVFYWYASGEFKTKIWFKIGIVSLITMGVLAYTNYEDPEKIEFRLGMLITTILVVLVGSPLLNLGEIIKSKTTDGMPFPIILTGTIVAASWALYGIAIKNAVVLYQNAFLLTLSAIQLSLFAIYPNTPREMSSISKTSTLNSSVQDSKASISKKDD